MSIKAKHTKAATSFVDREFLHESTPISNGTALGRKKNGGVDVEEPAGFTL